MPILYESEVNDTTTELGWPVIHLFIFLSQSNSLCATGITGTATHTTLTIMQAVLTKKTGMGGVVTRPNQLS